MIHNKKLRVKKSYLTKFTRKLETRYVMTPAMRAPTTAATMLRLSNPPRKAWKAAETVRNFTRPSYVT
jgi:hypothetical protein